MTDVPAAVAPSLHCIVLRADQPLHLGTGRGSGFSGTTRRHLPGSTLRGALCAAWWRDHPGSDQADFDARLAGLTFGDAVPGLPGADPWPLAAALDRRLCKYPQDGCPPAGHPWTVLDCPVCGRRTEPAKGERVAHPGAVVRSATRVALTPVEQARDEMLYERQGLVLDPDTRLIAAAAGDISWLAEPGQVLRVGAARSVAGRVSVESVEPIPAVTLELVPGENHLRIELLSPGVYVDDFGFAVARPTPEDVGWALGLPDGTPVAVERSFTRWTTASGWHAAAGSPKPEDAAVVAHSCFHLRVTAPGRCLVPAVVHNLGLRTAEGYGWALIDHLDAPDDPDEQPPARRPGDTGQEQPHA